MVQKRFGPTLGAGVVIIEKEAEKLITPAFLGTTGHVAIYQKGPISKLVRSRTPTEFRQMRGSFIIESLAPDAAFDFFEHGQGAGELNTIRVTDGTERNASLIIKSRENTIRQSVITVEAGFQNENNPGRWAGKKQTIVGQYTGVTNISLTTGKTFKLDEFKGGTLVLEELPGIAFQIEGNTITGVINLLSDSTLSDQLTASGGGNLTFALNLGNTGKAVSVLFKDGLENPTTEWGLEIFEDNIKVKEYPNLSSDPMNSKYFEKIVNSDSGNFWIKLTDLFTGTITANIRPSNFSGVSNTLLATTLTSKIGEFQITAASGTPKVEFDENLGSSILKDRILLTVTAGGTRAAGSITMSTDPSDSDTITIDFSTLDSITGTKVITFKTVVTDPLTEVLIGATPSDTSDNLRTFLTVTTYASGRLDYSTGVSPLINVIALDANDSLNAGTEFTESSTNFTFIQMIGGVDQTWTYIPDNQTDLPATVITTGKTLTAPNNWLMGGILHSTDITDDFAIADFVEMFIDPFPANELIGGFLIPNVLERRIKFSIISNTSNSITVKVGSDMTVDATVADKYIVEALIELSKGYDGIAGIVDQDYINKYDISTSFFNSLLGQNKGLVKLGTPGVTTTAIQKSGATYAEAKNYQYRYEIPSNIVTDSTAEEYINETLGRNDFAVTIFPSFGSVTDPEGDGGLKEISLTGAVHGREALIAKNFNGFFKAAAGIDVTLPRVLDLPTKERVLDEELLNPQGINVIKKKEGNFIIWGDRTVSIDASFKFKHQREYLSHVEHILAENFDFIIFALNNVDTQDSAKTSLTAYFLGEFSKGAFEGDSFSDAVRIKIDDENNTSLTKAAGDLNAEITIKIINTVERFIITIGKAGIFESLTQ